MLPLAAPLETIRHALLNTKFEGQVWLVGGAVRDELLARPQKNDFDLVTELSAHELATFLHELDLCGPPQIYPRFRTAMVRIGGSDIEFVTARKESYAEDSRKPDTASGTLLEDAQRRDFTANSLMRNLHSGELLDLLGTGLSDLDSKILRTPLDPVTTFYDDPLRMLRAVRFRWTLGFSYAPGLPDAIRSEAHRLRIVSAERIRDEFVKMLLLEEADGALRDLLELELLPQFAPELVAMVGVEQGRYHDADVWNHTLKVVRNAGNSDVTLALAALLHDVGKPLTRTIDEKGDTRFFSHETVGAEIARDVLHRMRFGGDQTSDVVSLVKNHMRLGSAERFSAPAIRRLIRDMGENLDRLLALVEADKSALRPGVSVMDLRPIIAKIHEIRTQTPAIKLNSPLSGQDIIALLDVQPGPDIGRAKKFLTEQVIEGELLPDDTARAQELLLAWWQEQA